MNKMNILTEYMNILAEKNAFSNKYSVIILALVNITARALKKFKNLKKFYLYEK